jgi:hypothetical protein
MPFLDVNALLTLENRPNLHARVGKMGATAYTYTQNNADRAAGNYVF